MPTETELCLYAAGLALFAGRVCFQLYRIKLHNDLLTLLRSLPPHRVMTTEEKQELRRLCERTDRFNSFPVGQDE